MQQRLEIFQSKKRKSFMEQKLVRKNRHFNVKGKKSLICCSLPLTPTSMSFKLKAFVSPKLRILSCCCCHLCASATSAGAGDSSKCDLIAPSAIARTMSTSWLETPEGIVNKLLSLIIRKSCFLQIEWSNISIENCCPMIF